jgi:hypothetical protein
VRKAYIGVTACKAPKIRDESKKDTNTPKWSVNQVCIMPRNSIILSSLPQYSSAVAEAGRTKDTQKSLSNLTGTQPQYTLYVTLQSPQSVWTFVPPWYVSYISPHNVLVFDWRGPQNLWTFVEYLEKYVSVLSSQTWYLVGTFPEVHTWKWTLRKSTSTETTYTWYAGTSFTRYFSKSPQYRRHQEKKKKLN